MPMSRTSRRIMGQHLTSLSACFFFSSRRRHTRCGRDWSSDVCSSDLEELVPRQREAEESGREQPRRRERDRKSTRLNSSHVRISYAVFCLKKKKKTQTATGKIEKKGKQALPRCMSAGQSEKESIV